MSPKSPPLEPLLAGTLALMSSMRRAEACPRMVAKVASNLATLGDSPGFSDEFRTVLARLAAHWAGMAPSLSALPGSCRSRAEPGSGPAAVSEPLPGPSTLLH